MQKPTDDEKADDGKLDSLRKELESVMRDCCKLDDQIYDLRGKMEPKFKLPLPLSVRVGSSKKGQTEEADITSLTLLEHEFKKLEEKRIEIVNQINVILQRKHKYDNIAEALMSELEVEHRHVQHSKHIEYLQSFDYEKWNTTKDCEQMTLMWPYLNLEGPREKDIFASIHPICKLVFETREKQNVMDEEPYVELEKIFNFDPAFFDRFILGKLPRAEFKKIMSSWEDVTYEKAKDVSRTLHDQALEKFNAFRAKYSQQTSGDQTPEEFNVFLSEYSQQTSAIME